ncbi:MAG: CoA transferase subunit A [Clostridia bacterium]|nr:MAG: CoA transferase subunit A [Clostridia bacterium]
MAERSSRVIDLETAAGLVRDGDTLGLSGFVLMHEPLALIRALIRRGVKDLTVVSLGGGVGLDMLVGAGCVRKVVTTYFALQHYAPIAPMYRRAMARKELTFWECDFQHWHCAMKAAGWNMPYLLTKQGVGTDLPLYNKDLKLVEVNGEQWIAVPPIPIDVAFLHASQADPYGNVIYNGSVLGERIIARATRRAIVCSCEELIPNKQINKEPRVVTLAGLVAADYVVHIPYGAHPEEGQGYYMHDSEHVKEYVAAAEATRTGQDPGAFQRYLERYVYGPATHEAYLEAIGGPAKLLKLKQSML